MQTRAINTSEGYARRDDQPTPLAIRTTVLAARRTNWSAALIRDHAVQFSEPVFHAALHRAVAELVAAHPPLDRRQRYEETAASTRLGA